MQADENRSCRFILVPFVGNGLKQIKLQRLDVNHGRGGAGTGTFLYSGKKLFLCPLVAGGGLSVLGCNCVTVTSTSVVKRLQAYSVTYS
jgi:hypothetical protein